MSIDISSKHEIVKEPETKTEIDDIMDDFELLSSKLISVKNDVIVLLHDFKFLERTLKRHTLNIKKNLKKATSNEKIGFNEMLITNEGCIFLKKPLGSKASRLEITKSVIKYIKENGLSDELSKKIKPDECLIKLLMLNDTDVFNLTMFNLHCYISVIFVN